MSGQEVTISVKTLQETKAVNVDSIIILNETNGSELRLSTSLLNDTIYKIDLNTGNLVLSTGEQNLNNGIQISAYPANNGVDFIIELPLEDNINIKMYSIDGKLISQKEVYCIAGLNRINYKTADPGLSIVEILTRNNRFTCKLWTYPGGKIIGSSKIANTYEINNFPVSDRKLHFRNSEWTYQLNDRILLTAKKGNINSGTWHGKPVDGSQIKVAIHKNDKVFDMQQTLSKGAQINTISFSGLAFYSGCFYASTFYPPGKVADYFGFQYMRDNDYDESGHNTDFLTKAAYYLMNLMDEDQIQSLIDLSVEQDSLFSDYALKRMILIKAFHRYLEGNIPIGTSSINLDSLSKVSAELYKTDGEISYGRAVKFAEIIRSFSEAQRDSLYQFGALGMRSWAMPPKPNLTIPKDMNVWVMSNASELFSWFLRGVEADIYFCPERQGTYFGGFYMKDAPAVGNPGYAIDPEATANKGSDMLNNILTPSQSAEIKNIYHMTGEALNGIVEMRTKISTELRKAIEGQTLDKAKILNWSEQYGNYDAMYIHSMVEQFVKVSKSLTPAQKNEMMILRDLEDFPCKEGKAYLYSAEINEPVIPNTDFMFH